MIKIDGTALEQMGFVCTVSTLHANVWTLTRDEIKIKVRLACGMQRWFVKRPNTDVEEGHAGWAEVFDRGENLLATLLAAIAKTYYEAGQESIRAGVRDLLRAREK